VTNTETYGVIGATGKTGKRVVARLQSRGHDVRGLARGTEPAFDWGNPDAWQTALAGIDRLYVAFVPDLAVAGSEAAITQLTKVARAAGVSRIVLLSGRGEAGAIAAEHVVLNSGIDATIVRAAWFSQNFTEGMLTPSIAEGFIAIPAGDRREPFVDVDDIADVAIETLIGEGHGGRVYEVTGPELVGFADVAALLTELRGHPVNYLAVSFDEFHAAIAADVDIESADLLTDLCREVFDGRNESLAHGVHEALGREPRSLRDVLASASVLA
jgi:uncharacterized protein YbjT (DUF2867 family)